MNKVNKTVLISAGGTGGHMFPAKALALDLISRGYNVELATDIRGVRYTPFVDNMPVHVLKTASLKAGILGKLKTATSLVLGHFQALQLLKKTKPCVVVGFGGYPSFPAVYAAQKKQIPTILHEQNAILGRANAMLAPKADRIALAWPSVKGLKESDSVRAITSGNPVRPDIAALYNKPYPVLDVDGEVRIFVLGGSQGANIFSHVLPETISRLGVDHRARLKITQQCREEDIQAVKKQYQEMGVKADLRVFFDDVEKQLEQCHLVIARSGAGTVAEVTTAGRPAIFVPYPYNSDDQQKWNADIVAEVGGAWVMTQGGFTVDALLTRLETFLQNPETLFVAAEKARTIGKPDAARKLGNLVTAIASGWDKRENKTFDLTQGREE